MSTDREAETDKDSRTFFFWKMVYDVGCSPQLVVDISTNLSNPLRATHTETQRDRAFVWCSLNSRILRDEKYFHFKKLSIPFFFSPRCSHSLNYWWIWQCWPLFDLIKCDTKRQAFRQPDENTSTAKAPKYRATKREKNGQNKIHKWKWVLVWWPFFAFRILLLIQLECWALISIHVERERESISNTKFSILYRFISLSLCVPMRIWATRKEEKKNFSILRAKRANTQREREIQGEQERKKCCV